MTQFLRDEASDSQEVVLPLMLDGTYLSRNFATLGPLPDSRRVVFKVTVQSQLGTQQPTGGREGNWEQNGCRPRGSG